MTSTNRADRRLEAGIADLATPQYPDYFNDVLAVTSRTRQRPAWTFPGRWIPMLEVTHQRVRTPRLPWRAVGILIAALLIVAIALAAIVGSHRQPPPPFGVARNGQIVYVHDGDIYLADPRSGAAHVAISGTYGHPEFSLDGTRMAFVENDLDSVNLYVAEADGSHRTKLNVAPIAKNIDLVWAPDGRTVAVSDADNHKILIARTDGSGVQELATTMPADSPAWRPPDGREVAFRGTQDGKVGIFAINPAGGSPRLVAGLAKDGDDIGFAAWSPDGSTLAYVYDAAHEGGSTASLHLVAADGTNDRVAPRSNPDVQDYSPAWSPDGRRLAIHRWTWDGTNGETWVSILSADGSGRPMDSDNRMAIEYAGLSGWTMAWSPDGRSLLAFEAGRSRVVQIDADSGHATAVPFDSTILPSWQRLAP